MINEPILDLQIAIFLTIGAIIFILVDVKVRDLKYYLPAYLLFPLGYFFYYLHHTIAIYRLMGNVIFVIASILLSIGVMLEYSHIVKNTGKWDKKLALVFLSPTLILLIGIQIILIICLMVSLILLLIIFRKIRSPRHISLLFFQGSGIMSVLSTVLDNFQIIGAWEFSYLTVIIFATLFLTIPIVAYFEQILVKSEKRYYMAYNRAELYKDLFAHDISNILQYIKSSVDIFELYQKDPRGKDQINEAISILNEQTIRGSNLVKNIRKLSELTDVERKLKQINLFRILNENIEYIKKSYSNREISVSIIPSKGDFYIQANELFLIAGENILINAIRYNKNPKIEITIEISFTEKNNVKYIKIEFKDNGIGVSDDIKKHLFLDIIKKEGKSKGMGLGLLLVKRILESYNAEICVEDKIKGDPSKGSNFIILIPEAS